MILSALIATQRACAAARESCSLTVKLGARHDPDERGVMLRVGGWTVQVDGDGLMALNTARIAARSAAPPVLEVDLDEPPAQAWVVEPDALRGWLQAVASGRPVDDVMTELEIAGIDDEVEVP